MPHLVIQYSKNLAQRADIKIFCEQMKHGLLSLNLYPAAGIRVRAAPQDDYVIADGHPENGFLDMTLRIGAGRTEAQKKPAKPPCSTLQRHFLPKNWRAGIL
jgi:5-carboxymethyl-2-hydroxymuconate isomerase